MNEGDVQGVPYGLKELWAEGGGAVRLGLLVCALAPLMLPLWAWKVYHDRHAWPDFAAAHACKPVAQVQANPGIAAGSRASGQAPMSSADGKTAYLCNDGVTYWH